MSGEAFASDRGRNLKPTPKTIHRHFSQLLRNFAINKQMLMNMDDQFAEAIADDARFEADQIESGFKAILELIQEVAEKQAAGIAQAKAEKAK